LDLALQEERLITDKIHRLGAGRVRSILLSQFASTVGQSLGEHFVLGTTGKLLHAGLASGVATGDKPLDEADDLEVSRDVHGDLGHRRHGELRPRASRPGGPQPL
jgi:hypothetical protein